MARPRVFISSTFYDLQHVRADLERFVSGLGYEPVLHERGSVPYGSIERLEEYCYREVQLADIVVSVIGGRYGSPSQENPYSVSQRELTTAIESDIPVFVFVESSVLAEYKTYLLNKLVDGIQYQHVDDSRVYSFLEEVHSLPRNNPIIGFDSAQQIIEHLRAQWAGLFQSLLSEQQRLGQVRLIEDLRSGISTINRLVTFLTAERRSSEDAIQSILLINHPAFRRIRSATDTPYRVIFTNRDEMASWLKAHRFTRAPWDDSDKEEWMRESSGATSELLSISREIFDQDGNLRVFTEDQWNESWISIQELTSDPYGLPASEDDMPF